MMSVVIISLSQTLSTCSALLPDSSLFQLHNSEHKTNKEKQKKIENSKKRSPVFYSIVTAREGESQRTGSRGILDIV